MDNAGSVGKPESDNATPTLEVVTETKDAVDVPNNLKDILLAMPPDTQAQAIPLSVSCPNMLAALMSKPKAMMNVTQSTSTITSASAVTPGILDSEGFLTPPPASTLLLRRTRVNSAGSSTYVIASGAPGTPTTSTPSNLLTSGPISNTTPAPLPVASDSGNTEGRGRSRSTRSIKRPKFDDEIVDYTTLAELIKKKDSASSLSPLLTQALEKTSPLDSRLSGATNTLLDPVTGLFLFPEDATLVPPVTPKTTQGGKSISIKSKPKSSKGKPASFTADSAAGLKKQRKERSADKNKNLDPRTGKRRYIKKRGFRLSDRPRLGRTVSQGSDYSVSGDVSATWRPCDDLRLIINVKQTCDLKMVHVGTMFSCDFTLGHIEARWNALLHNESVSKVSQMAINNLHSKVRADILAHALYSEEEDELIKTVESTSSKARALLLLDDMLKSNALKFVKYRTVQHLWNHWKELKEFHLLNDQQVEKYFEHEDFADVEPTLNDEDIQMETVDSAVYQELLIENRHIRKKIRVAEEELIPWKTMAEMAGEIKPEEDEAKSFAMLRGGVVRYLMQSREITIGRMTKDNNVDVDLALEGTGYKISRRQGIIKLRNTGDFIFINRGKHSVVLDGETLLPQHTGLLRDRSVIQVSAVKLVFIVNPKMVFELRATVIKENLRREFNGLGADSFFRATGKMGRPLPKFLNSSVPHSILGSYSSNLKASGFNVRPGHPAQFLPSSYNPRPAKNGGSQKPSNPRSKKATAAAQRLPFQASPTSKSNFPLPHHPIPTPTIFRKSSTSTPLNPVAHELQPPQQSTSFQLGDLTIRPGAPPS